MISLKRNHLSSLLTIALCLAFAANISLGQQKRPVDYIDPMIGASTSTEAAGVLHGLGKTFPGAATPFGLVQLSPDTITGGDNGPGYSWHHNTIEGFSFTHMSGIGWYGDLGNFLVMPTTGPLQTACGRVDFPDEGYRSRFSHDSEIARAGYYAVELSDYQIKAEMTASPHAGILRFTFPQADTARIQIDLARRIGGTSVEQYVKVVDDHTIHGWMKCTPAGGGWGNGDGKADYTVYFYCQFSKPLSNYGIWHASIPDDWSRKLEDIVTDKYRHAAANATVVPGCREMQGKHLGFYSEFSASSNEQVLVKTGISFVDINGAKNNLETEIDHWDFDSVAQNAANLWNDSVSRIMVSGGSEEQKTIFYTAMYHTMVDPRCVSDVDGRYLAADGKIHTSDKFQYRTIFSGWDVFRSQFPLQSIINPELVNDQINSLIQLAKLSGKEYYPRWEILNSYSGCMIGNPAVAVVLDAFSKGIDNFDVEMAYDYCRNSVEKFGNQPLGYQPEDISRTLEYAYTDWCTGRFADMLGKTDDAAKYYQRSKAYKNIYDPSVSWFRPRKADGQWAHWQGKTVHGQGCVESNPYQQGWFVPHDVEGLIELFGEEYFLQELKAFFEKAPEKFTWNDYYNHANEPVHHVAFMFPYIGKPWLTQKWTRIICDQAYGTGVDGLCGNEDVGQMSAWYILAASGLHPVCPGDGIYILTAPVFEEINLTLDRRYASSDSFRIIAMSNSPANTYIQSLKLNGQPLNRLWLTHKEIISGGTLELQMGPQPNTKLGADPKELLKQTKPLLK
ncbi:MAG: GH92 family glycosyl hydrolase [Sedimentisphaerales bacterium]|nr:GH92 family glycosyl hydrolase [Sedimentisphaerales bacterium]MBN2841685.1 GH92 family glycosyl hydrolase [Sedimentisphaerales bacterium]